MLKIDEGGDDQSADEDAIDQHKAERLMSVNSPKGEEEEAGEQFNQKIATGNGRFAVGAFATQINPGEQRDVEIPGNGVLAMRTVGARRNHALAERHSVNADIEKTADHATEGEEDQRPEMERNEHPLVRIEDRPNSHKCYA